MVSVETKETAVNAEVDYNHTQNELMNKIVDTLSKKCYDTQKY